MHRAKKIRLDIAFHRAFHRAFLASIAVVVAIALPAWSSDMRAKSDVQSLDQQVQDIKSEVLSIAAELRALEEQLLHPSSTQVSVFVEVGSEQDVRVDATRVWIDGEPVAHHIYTHHELEALRNGGVQRIYTGNIREGEHSLRVEVEGSRTTTGRFASTQDFTIAKGVGPKKVGVTLNDSLTGGAQVAIADW